MKKTFFSMRMNLALLFLLTGYALSASHSVWAYNAYDWLPASSCMGGDGMETVYYGGSYHYALRITDGSSEEIPAGISGMDVVGSLGGVICPIPRIYPRRPEYVESISIDFVSGPGPSSGLPRDPNVHAVVYGLDYRLGAAPASPGKTLYNLNGVGTITFTSSELSRLRSGNWTDYLHILITGEGNYVIGYRIYWNLPK